MYTLPETSSTPSPLPRLFPLPHLDVLYANWGLVPVEALARTLEASPGELARQAVLLGLDPSPRIDPRWLKRGYLTLIRNNWHLLPFGQLCALTGFDPEHLAFLLKEDDFLWHKMGMLKPQIQPVRFCPLAPEQEAQVKLQIKRLNAVLGGRGALSENGFDFLSRYEGPAPTPLVKAPSGGLRIIYSYFALYGDPLMESELDPFPDALLSQYARMGVNGVFLQGLLYQLTPFDLAPELSQGWQTRVQALNALCQRSARFGIGVYLYLNEPRAMDQRFFDRYPELRGEREGDFWALCTSHPTVQRYLEESMHALFHSVPLLAGYLNISMSENLTNCYSRTPADQVTCPRCAKRAPWAVVAEVNNLMCRGMKRANPRANAIIWSWAWPDAWADKAMNLLSEGQIVQCTAEDSLRTNVGGIPGVVQDYTLSQPGPSARSQALWRHARSLGLETSAKLQLNNTWELAAVPFLPVFSQVEKLIRGVQAQGVRHLQLSWTLGGCPSPNLLLAHMLMEGKGRMDFLGAFYGTEYAQRVDHAQRLFSQGFSEFPFCVQTAYTAPQNFGPAAPFYLEPTHYRATMIGFPYDDLTSWRGIYPEEVFEAQFEKLCGLWAQGLEGLTGLREKNEALDELYRVAAAALCHFESALHHIRFIRAQSTAERLETICLERKTVLALMDLRAQDSRLGYEASNHYFYTLNDLKMKLLRLDALESALK